MRPLQSLRRDLCISNPGRLIPLLPGSIRLRKRFSRLFSVELLIPPNTDIHHRGLRGLNWKLPTSEINLNRLAVCIVISVPMLNGKRYYPASKSSVGFSLAWRLIRCVTKADTGVYIQITKLLHLFLFLFRKKKCKKGR